MQNLTRSAVQRGLPSRAATGSRETSTGCETTLDFLSLGLGRARRICETKGELAMRRKLVWMFVLIALVISVTGFGGYLVQTSAEERPPADPPGPHKKGMLYEDQFGRDDLGDAYEVVNPDPNRLTLSDGKLLIVATEPLKNVVLLNKPLPSDFVATVTLNMQVTTGNQVGLVYWIDDQNFLSVGIDGARLKEKPLDDGRQPSFWKAVGGQMNAIRPAMTTLGSRELVGYTEKPEIWHLQLQRVGTKYTGRISIDGVRWTNIGTHVIIRKDGRLGPFARSGKDGIENAAEFDDLNVQG